MKKITGICIFLFICSCGFGKKPFEKRMNEVLGEMVFRGHTLGESYTTILKSENRKYLQFPDSNILKYMYHVSDSEEYHWAYVFEMDHLKQIQFDAYLGDQADGDIYTSLVKKRYQKNWGSPQEKNGICTWKKEEMSIDLVNESPIVSMGKVKLLIYYSTDSTIQKYIPDL
jgi:hypothetical protein